MLETAQRDGRGRVLDWTPGERTVQSPLLIVPETRAFGRPDDADVILTAQPQGDGADGKTGPIELVSDGTWFHPRGHGDDAGPHGLVVRAPQPAPTGQVQLVTVGDELAVWHDAGGWASNPRNAVPALVHARTDATEGRLLWAPALGSPADYAVWAYLGIDAFDASPLLLAAIRGEALTVDGPVPLRDAEALHGDGGTWDAADLAAFNLRQAREELARIRLAIRDGRLRALAERRAYAHPSTVELLRRFDREHAYLEAATPVHKETDVPCMTQESLWMPEVERFRRRLRETYRPPAMADTLVLLPCSAGKPYRTSKSHRYFQRALDDSGLRHRCHEVMVTSPLGVVPRELEEVYPADRYDVPVTGHWNRDEEALIREQVAALLAAHDYKHVVAHVPASTFTFLRDILPEGTHHTAHTHSPQSKVDCDRLRDRLAAIKEADPQPFDRRLWGERKLQDLQALLSWQFDADVADAMTAGGKARGRHPYTKLDQGGVQVGMTTAGRGLLSLTLDGADIVARHGVKRVRQGGFQIKKTGSLFAVGVEGADADIRPGDDVVVVRSGSGGDEVTACGIAQMSAAEMIAMKRGVAVQLRHVRKEDEPPRPVQAPASTHAPQDAKATETEVKA